MHWLPALQSSDLPTPANPTRTPDTITADYLSSGFCMLSYLLPTLPSNSKWGTFWIVSRWACRGWSEYSNLIFFNEILRFKYHWSKWKITLFVIETLRWQIFACGLETGFFVSCKVNCISLYRAWMCWRSWETFMFSCPDICTILTIRYENGISHKC